LTILVLEAHLADELGVLQLNEAVSDALTGGKSRVLGAHTSSLLGGIVFTEGVDTDLASHVELVGDGSSPDVEPVWVEWGEVLVAGGFIVLGPLLKI